MKEPSSVNPQNKSGLKPYLSPLAVRALSVGTAIGWGSLVVTSRTYLSQAGPLGSILGLLIGLAMMLLQGRDYQARNEILRVLNAQIEDNIKTGKAVASLGLAEFNPETDQSFHQVFARADELMYERKMQLKAMGAVTRD